MTSDDDIVRYFFDLLRPELSQIERMRLEVKARQDWGGTRPYIAKHPALKKSLDVGCALGTGARLLEAFAEAGVGRSFGFSLVRRHWRR